MDTNVQNLTHEQKLKVSVFNEVRKICDEIGEKINISYDRKAMDLISELVWKKLQIHGEDLEAFAKHAKRTTINNEDVKLLVRRNPELKSYIGRLIDEQNAGKEPRNRKQKKETTDNDNSEKPPDNNSDDEDPFA